MTLAEMFPGNVGRLTMARVILRLRMPELVRMPVNEPLPVALEVELRAALLAVKKG